MGWVRESRLALRGLFRRPGYAAMVIGVMGIGIGATTTVLTIADRVLLRGLPYPEAERLVVLGSTFPGREWEEGTEGLQHLAGFSVANFIDWRERARSFELMAGVEHYSILLPDQGAGPELAQSTAVTPDFFSVLQVRPEVGRVFHPDEFSSASSDVVMLSYDAWQNRYGGDPSIVGAVQSTISGSSEVVGVLPANFDLPEVLGAQIDDFWFPIRMDSDRYADRGRRGLIGLALMRPGVTIDAARAEMGGLAAQLADEFPDGNVYPDGRRLGAGANSLRAHTVGATGLPISLFMGAAIILLLIAGLNTANLVLVRGLSRSREIDVRLALGAGQRRLVRMLLTETVFLAAVGGGLGVLLANMGVRAFRALGPASLPRMAEVGLDARILLMAVGITLGSGLLTGLIPALRLTRGASSGALRGDGARVAGDGSSWPWAVSAQVALSVLLMVSAALLMESFIRVQTFDPGFEPGGALTFRQGLKRPGAADLPVHGLWDEVLTQVAGTGAYAQVAATSNLPYQSPNWAPWVLLPEDGEESHRTGIAGYVISNGYLETLGIPLIEGRTFTEADRPEGEPVILVNQAFVATQMGGRGPVGTTLRFREGDSFKTLTVVGVVGNTVQSRAEDGILPAVFVPYTQSDWPSIWVFARTEGDPLSGVDLIRRRIAEVNPYIPPLNIATMQERIGRTRTGPRFNAALASAFGLVSLLLSAGGLYGALSFGVGRRTKEIGVRIALGADRASVLKMILSRGLWITAVGTLVGLVAAGAASRMLSAFLFEVRPTSPVSFLMAAGLLIMVAVVASLAPALRATRVDPITSLSAE